ncbi:TNF receptor-associated factor 4 isoform X1 [Oopsacas minuta]|uniref:TNF receptor-associated factor 4 isoform X1 n=1 Tax=Oopsacas minuta TaxID=111878 RepID=A0AAV7JIK7_9METZ|nr:TNF receptor-associated factor 4 isoform X1 [Oopsacas minuta]
MNPHLEDCEHFPVPCPNGCVAEGEEGTKQMTRRDVPVHLADECPLQKVQCTCWNHECERLSMVDMKLKQTETSKLLQGKLDTANNEIEILKKHSTEQDSEQKSVREVLYSYTPLPLPTGQFEWNIQGVTELIKLNKTTYSSPFHVGLYKCQGKNRCNYDNTGKIGVFIGIMKGEYDDKLHLPIKYKYTFILLNQVQLQNLTPPNFLNVVKNPHMHRSRTR